MITRTKDTTRRVSQVRESVVKRCSKPRAPAGCQARHGWRDGPRLEIGARVPLEVGTEQLEAAGQGALGSAPSSSGETNATPLRAFSLEADEPRNDSLRQGLTFDMSGGPKGAKRPLERPLDGGVRRHRDDRVDYPAMERPGRSSSQAMALIFQPAGVLMNCVVTIPRVSNDFPPDVPDFA